MYSCTRSGAEEESAPDGNVVVARLMGGVEYGRPLATGWTGTLGVNWQRAKCLNEHGSCITQVRAFTMQKDLWHFWRLATAPLQCVPHKPCKCAPQDAYGGPLTFSGGNSDTLMLALLRAAYSGRSDTHLVASMEQALPLQPDWLNFNRFCVRAEGSMPILKGLRAHVSGKGAEPQFRISTRCHKHTGCGRSLLLHILSLIECVQVVSSWGTFRHMRPSP